MSDLGQDEPSGDECDNCGNAIDGMQAASSDVCWDCWQGAKGTVERLEARIQTLGDELGRSELRIQQLEAELAQLRERVALALSRGAMVDDYCSSATCLSDVLEALRGQ